MGNHIALLPSLDHGILSASTHRIFAEDAALYCPGTKQHFANTVE